VPGRVPYTETFIRGIVGGLHYAYVVPVGRRAVVTSIVIVNYGPNLGYSDVAIGNAYISVAYPAANTTTGVQLRAVAYQGETIHVNVGPAGQQVVVSGYLFDDDSGATGPAPISVERIEEGRPLPALADVDVE
jgi:hypothetical protein